ncbi:MAG: Maf family protein [Pseudomonadota bacterium]
MMLILGSASPRRLELLRQLGVVPDRVRPADIDETPARGELPRPYCARMAAQKAAAFDVAAGEIVLTADTTVALGRRILGKPEHADQARDYLNALSGRRHKVISCLTVRTSDQTWHRDCVTTVKMKRMSAAEITDYLATEDWKGKAGAYAIQGPAAAFIPWIQGSYSGVMGLPLAETAAVLRAAGLKVMG